MNDINLGPWFWNRTRIVKSTGCVEWTAGGTSGGYGTLRLDGKQHYAHRVAYRALVGELTPGLQIDHLCRNRRCVNVEHLELVPPWVNNSRGYSIAAQNYRRTHCQRGHSFDEANTLWRADSKTGAMHRLCQACVRVNMDRRNAERRKTRSPRRPSPCGTQAAYQRHIYNREQPCAPCRAAQREYIQGLRAKGRLGARKRSTDALRSLTLDARRTLVALDGAA